MQRFHKRRLEKPVTAAAKTPEALVSDQLRLALPVAALSHIVFEYLIWPPQALIYETEEGRGGRRRHNFAIVLRVDFRNRLGEHYLEPLAGSLSRKKDHRHGTVQPDVEQPPFQQMWLMCADEWHEYIPGATKLIDIPHTTPNKRKRR